MNGPAELLSSAPDWAWAPGWTWALGSAHSNSSRELVPCPMVASPPSCLLLHDELRELCWPAGPVCHRDVSTLGHQLAPVHRPATAVAPRMSGPAKQPSGGRASTSILAGCGTVRPCPDEAGVLLEIQRFRARRRLAAGFLQERDRVGLVDVESGGERVLEHLAALAELRAQDLLQGRAISSERRRIGKPQLHHDRLDTRSRPER